MEFHSLSREIENKFKQLIEKLDQAFVCVHAHPNNRCGDFLIKGTNMNMPNIIEMTFLRRDRIKNNESTLNNPILPHPLDIINVSRNPPLFLNEEWLLSGKRKNESKIAMLNAEVDFYRNNCAKIEKDRNAMVDAMRNMWTESLKI